MKLAKSLLLGSAAGLATVVAAQAADLPTRKAAPVEYVRVCDAYGAGFFYIPGTDTCLRVGGLVLAAFGIQPSSQLYSVGLPIGSAVGSLGAGFPGLVGTLPSTATYRPVFTREIFGYNATGRIELDARTQSPFGTVRTFIRLTSQYGSSANYTTGSLASALGINGFNNLGGPTVSKEVTYLDKAFIQFAGITAGRVQSFFDFYADAINYASLRGSNQTTWAAAYTFTFGGGFSATGSFEDTASHRGPVTSVISAGGAPGIAPLSPVTGLGAAGGVAALTGAARMPDFIGNLRWDQPWGAAQLSGAVRLVRANLFPSTSVTSGATGVPASYAFAPTGTSTVAFAVQGGLQFNLDMLAPGDKLWLQATYARGSIGYVSGNDLAFVSGPSATANYGIGVARTNNGVGWGNSSDFDCVFTYTGRCELSDSFVVLGALKHYWTPTISSGLFGDYYQVTYSNGARFPISPITSAVSGGVSNYREVRVGTNLVWTPVKNFDIGAEFTYMRFMTDRPYGLAPDAVLKSYGLPKFTGTTNQYVGQIRMIRAF